MRILISGAGPAGLTGAYRFTKNGNDVVLVERAQHLRLDGYGLDFFGTGFDVAERIHIVDNLEEHKLRAEQHFSLEDIDQAWAWARAGH
jgi:2-polyprenyl-6-methoxyphenol hydroxylase-like FAD-dependent oxidoreductase